jgi:membrane protein
MLKRIKFFFLKDIWHQPVKAYSPTRKFIIKQTRIFTLAFRGFAEDKVQMRASALTYYSLLSIVPIAAMAFGIAKGFGFDLWLQKKLYLSLSGQEKVLEWILTFVNRYLSRINGGLIAGVGVAMLIWSVMKLLGNIESSFNDIWQIKKARVISRKLSDYLSLIVIAPILLFISSGVTVFLAKQIQNSSEMFPLVGYIGPILSLVVALIPYILIWLVFTLIYIIMPNTKVQLKSALIAGVIAGTIFQILQLGYIHFQSLVSSYGAVYGSFAALPLFLIWMQTSWLILLFGAEVAFANQNVEHYAAESVSLHISHHLKRAVSLMLLHEIVLRFKEGKPAATAEELALKLGFPVRLVRDIIYELLETRLISETTTINVKENAYQPAQDIQRLKVAYIIDLLDKRGNTDLTSVGSKELENMVYVVDGFLEEIKHSKNNKLLSELDI